MECDYDNCDCEKRGCEGCFFNKLNKAIDEKLKETKKEVKLNITKVSKHTTKLTIDEDEMTEDY